VRVRQRAAARVGDDALQAGADGLGGGGGREAQAGEGGREEASETNGHDSPPWRPLELTRTPETSPTDADCRRRSTDRTAVRNEVWRRILRRSRRANKGAEGSVPTPAPLRPHSVPTPSPLRPCRPYPVSSLIRWLNARRDCHVAWSTRRIPSRSRSFLMSPNLATGGSNRYGSKEA